MSDHKELGRLDLGLPKEIVAAHAITRAPLRHRQVKITFVDPHRLNLGLDRYPGEGGSSACAHRAVGFVCGNNSTHYWGRSQVDRDSTLATRRNRNTAAGFRQHEARGGATLLKLLSGIRFMKPAVFESLLGAFANFLRGALGPVQLQPRVKSA